MWWGPTAVALLCTWLAIQEAAASRTFNIGIVIPNRAIYEEGQASPVVALEAFAHAKHRNYSFIPELSDLQNDFSLILHVVQVESVLDPSKCVPPVAQVQVLRNSLWVATAWCFNFVCTGEVSANCVAAFVIFIACPLHSSLFQPSKRSGNECVAMTRPPTHKNAQTHI